MGLLLNRAKADTATTGTGAVTPGSAVVPYQSWASAGATSGYWYPYLIEDGNDWEIGLGSYNGTTITRPGPGTDLEFASSTGALLNLTGSAKIACVANAKNYQPEYMFFPPQFSLGAAQTLSFNSMFHRPVIADRDAVVSAVNILCFAAQTGPVITPFIYSGWVAGGARLATGSAVTNLVLGVNAMPLTTPLKINKGDRMLIGFLLTVANSTVVTNIPSAMGSAYTTSQTSVPSTVPAFTGTDAINSANYFLSV